MSASSSISAATGGAEGPRAALFAGGLASLALAVLLAERRVRDGAETVLFIDAGAERPETLELAGRLAEWLRGRGLRLETVRPSPTLEAAILQPHQRLPGPGRRWCIERFKVRPAERWLRARGAAVERPGELQLPLPAELAHRAADAWWSPTVHRRWPLVELGLGLEDCRALVQRAGWRAPSGWSGCWLCPFQAQADWQELALRHPDLLERAIALEEHARGFRPGSALPGHGLAIRTLLAAGPRRADDILLADEQELARGHCNA